MRVRPHPRRIATKTEITVHATTIDLRDSTSGPVKRRARSIFSSTAIVPLNRRVVSHMGA